MPLKNVATQSATGQGAAIKFSHIIGGRKVTPEVHEPVINPATGEVVGLMPVGTVDDLDAAVKAAREAFVLWRLVSDTGRQSACSKIAAKLNDHAEELARLLTLEQGKPLGGLGSRWEIGGAQAWTAYSGALDIPIKTIQDNNEGRVELHRKPIGVVGSITPWNFPVLIASWHIIPAIRAGNTVVIKPSPNTPLSTIRFVQLLNEILPPGVVNVVAGDNALGAAMASHRGIDKMVFTGSIATGKKIMASAAETLKKLTLELGGNDAGIVLPDANPSQIAEGLFWGAFINNGQTCAALKRLYVHDSIYDEVCGELVKLANTVSIGDGLDEKNVLGPIQNEMQFRKICELVEDARVHGGRILTGGTAPENSKGYFYPVTLVADVNHGIRLVDEEQFGPALPIIRYHDIDEVIARANDNQNGLGGSIWSSNVEEARKLALRLECGTAWVNKHGAIQPNAPFGGIKNSGIGVEFGEEGLFENTNIQVVIS
ncbi:acyl-CoA reductase-like NAD-dependent aldehyde dehydrogenase [Bradyrhizobium diazoefficiens]|uniref:aldehyde dehydrogenase family protein n=1 Tax=Bradyrhizobium diazoefficiens TaxID=1355477 RepID=UPI003511C83C